MVLLGDVNSIRISFSFLREKYIALYERIKLYLLNRLTPVCILGCEGDEKYENLYPTREKVLGITTDESEEEN